jgi:hypothetical protein
VRKLVSLLVLGLAAALAVSAFALAGRSATHMLGAKLTAGVEVPKPKAPMGASGTFSATLSGATLKWKLSFSHLSGAAAAAHIHKGAAGVAGPVLVPLCGPCKSGMTGTVKISATARKIIASKPVYVNVHTAKNAGGEIRGQVKVSG